MVQITYVTPDGEEHHLEAKPGMTLMQLATSEGLPGIEGECGGVLSCATCHVHVNESWFPKLSPPRQDELDMLRFADDTSSTSRLCCQIKATPELDGLTVRIPVSQ